MTSNAVRMPFLLMMPSYNQAHYIKDAVESVLVQDDPDWELWIVDNSTDDTVSVVRRFSDPRIRFHHFPERMDPGSCLNWMLEHAVGRDFSYVHTDNNLHVSYVRSMRRALSEHPLALAYCDMKLIDQVGRPTEIFHRGQFDLPRLLSADTLGVPFAATTELAKQMGGFSVRDFADDVRFCVGAYGLALYVYVREPLLDYRIHANSRTEAAGGGGQMQRLFAALMPKIVPMLEERGLRPVELMERSIVEGLDDLDRFVEDHWYRGASKLSQPWWNGAPRMEPFFFAGLIDVPGFNAKTGRPSRWQPVRDQAGRICVFPWRKYAIRRYFRRHRKDLRRIANRVGNMLPTWACMKLGITSCAQIRFRIKSIDFRTLWVARYLEQTLGWEPLLDIASEGAPKWLGWGMANGNEPLLDCSGEISLTTAIL